MTRDPATETFAAGVPVVPREALQLLGLSPDTPVRLPRVDVGRGIPLARREDLLRGPQELVLLPESRFFGIDGVVFLVYGSVIDPAPVLVPTEVANAWRWNQYMEREFLKLSAKYEASAQMPAEPAHIANWSGR
jgi:hypothetical protein